MVLRTGNSASEIETENQVKAETGGVGPFSVHRHGGQNGQNWIGPSKAVDSLADRRN
jgi:hypothetical protein